MQYKCQLLLLLWQMHAFIILYDIITLIYIIILPPVYHDLRMIKPVGMYGVETWAIKKLQVAEMRYLRTIRGVLLRDRMRMKTYCMRGRLDSWGTRYRRADRWYRHVKRRDGNDMIRWGGKSENWQKTKSEAGERDEWIVWRRTEEWWTWMW